ncbi:ascorbic acid mannose pathway regulator 1 [Euphorbia peplus]|nr:ascorbic acid mannose pathway regulator 1 [Euphorbia peplus]
MVQYSPPLYGCGDRKNLVEHGGDLYIVDRYFNGERRKWEDGDGEMYNQVNEKFRVRNLAKCRAESVHVRVYKFDEEWGRWVDVKSLGKETVFVIGNESCFSVRVEEFGDCVYYVDPYDEDVRGEISGSDARVFRLADRKIGRASSFHGFSQILWPHKTVKDA